ncbi:hypothetical protein [Leifsonia aquatica]|uniref:hypothetical protein n=1 Tax=Leifsonia aquatica TaxID=144185 RepID=UPI0037F65F20
MGALRPVRAVVDDPAATVLDLQAKIRAMQGVDLGETRLPTSPAIAGLLPDGALVAGQSYQLSGSTALLQAVLAGPSLAGAWCAVVGMPDFGLEAAAAAGIDLERLVLVPQPGEKWWQVVSALVETMTAIAVHPPEIPAAGDLARLQGKLRTHDAVLLVDRDWPGARAALTIRARRTAGLGEGWGLLAGRELDVVARGRGGTRTGTVRLVDGQLAAVVPALEHGPVSIARATGTRG